MLNRIIIVDNHHVNVCNRLQGRRWTFQKDRTKEGHNWTSRSINESILGQAIYLIKINNVQWIRLVQIEVK